MQVHPREVIEAVSRTNFKHSKDSLSVLKSLIKDANLTAFSDDGSAFRVHGDMGGHGVAIVSNNSGEDPRYLIGSTTGVRVRRKIRRVPAIAVHVVETPEGTKFKTTHKNITYRGLVKHPILGPMLEKLKELGIPHETSSQKKQPKLLSEPEMTVYGVDHSASRLVENEAGTSNKFTPTENILAISKELNKLKKLHVKKFGIESVERLPQPKRVFIGVKHLDRTTRYFRAITLQAQRKKLKVHGLEESPKGNLLLKFGVVLNEITNGRVEYKYTFKEHFERLINGRHCFFEAKDKTNVLKLVDYLQHNSPNIFRNLYGLNQASILARSLEMFENAKSKKLKHIIVGADHARDLELLKNVRVNYVNNVTPTHDSNSRIAHYDRFKDLLNNAVEYALAA